MSVVKKTVQQQYIFGLQVLLPESFDGVLYQTRLTARLILLFVFWERIVQALSFYSCLAQEGKTTDHSVLRV